MKISAVLIVKNEEVLLSRCLESVKGVDEIIIADTGSTDNTIEVAKKYTDKIYTDKKWEDDFAACRNYAKSFATGDWIISIDADEYLHDFAAVREACLLAEQQKAVAVNITMKSEENDQSFSYPRLFKNTPEVYWAGNVHNHLSRTGIDVGNVIITHGYSPAHNLDPDRALRTLEKDVKLNGGPREMFYLGREYYYRGRNEEAVKMLGQYTQNTRHMAEKADAYLTMAKCYWAMGMGEDAREAVVHALIINANFKEAILFMAKASGEGSGNHKWEENARQWKRMAETATNDDVLFIRNV